MSVFWYDIFIFLFLVFCFGKYLWIGISFFCVVYVVIVLLEGFVGNGIVVVEIWFFLLMVFFNLRSILLVVILFVIVLVKFLVVVLMEEFFEEELIEEFLDSFLLFGYYERVY